MKKTMKFGQEVGNFAEHIVNPAKGLNKVGKKLKNWRLVKGFEG